jgi:hypothetical protein
MKIKVNGTWHEVDYVATEKRCSETDTYFVPPSRIEDVKLNDCESEEIVLNLDDADWEHRKYEIARELYVVRGMSPKSAVASAKALIDALREDGNE